MTAEPEKATEEVADLGERLEAKRQTMIPYTEYGNAERLIHDHGDDLIHVPGMGWFVWNGRFWEPDQDGAVMRRTKATVRRMREVAARIADETVRDALWDWARKCETRAKLENTIALAASEEFVFRFPDGLDADPMLFNVRNGTIELRTGGLRPHRREDLLTKVAPVEYDPNAKCPVWDALLERVLPVRPVRDFVQRGAGYSLTGDTGEQCLFLPHGSGANGKSTFLEALGAAMGDYAASASSETFMTRHGRGVREDLARLRGARFVRAVEVEDDARLAEVLIKQMTGGDKLVASFLYQNSFEFEPSFKVWIAANHLPEIRGADHAIWRRLRLIPFEVKIEHPDKRLKHKLKEELPGILAWAVRGCLAWQAEGLGLPEAVRGATQEYRREQDSVAQFISACCVVRPGASVAPSDLFAAYKAFCGSLETEPLGQRRFVSSLRNRGFRQPEDARPRIWSGIALRGPT